MGREAGLGHESRIIRSTSRSSVGSLYYSVHQVWQVTLMKERNVDGRRPTDTTPYRVLRDGLMGMALVRAPAGRRGGQLQTPATGLGLVRARLGLMLFHLVRSLDPRAQVK
jgi:hypothetical protein